MIGELKDIWIVFRKAYNEHFALKLKAFDAIKECESKLDSIDRVCYLLDETYRNLDELYLQLPIKERQDFIQSTLDLIRYGVRTNEDGSFSGYGFNEIYHNLYRKLKSDYKYIKKLYKEKRYDDVIEQADDLLERVNNFYLEYNITEQK